MFFFILFFYINLHKQRCDNYVLDVIFILIFNNNKYSVSVMISEDLDYSYFMMLLHEFRNSCMEKNCCYNIPFVLHGRSYTGWKCHR